MGKAGLENLCNDVFPEALVLDMHHGIVALRIEGLARFAEGLDAQRVEDLDKLCQGHLHALFIGLVCGLVMQGPLEVIIDGKELLHRIGNGILIDAVLFALRALAEVVILRSQPQKLIVLLRLRGLGLLQRIGLFGLGLLLGAFRLLRRFRLLGGLRSGRLLLVLRVSLPKFIPPPLPRAPPALGPRAAPACRTSGQALRQSSLIVR